MKNSFSQQMTEAIRAAVDTVFDGSKIKAAEACNSTYSTVSRWYNGESSPRIEDIAQLMDLAGYRLVKKDEDTNDKYHFECPEKIDAKDMSAFQKDEFLALPIVDSLDLLTRFTSPSNRSGWALVEKKAKCAEGRSNLIAYIVTDNLMSPTINKDDWVLIDRDDIAIEQNRIYLVRFPDGRTVIRRVCLNRSLKHLIIMNDNTATPRCDTISIEKDCGGDVSKAILGRVIWMRADLSKR